MDAPAPDSTLRLHLLAANARGDLTLWVDGTEHRLAAGDPAVVHELAVTPGVHELEFLGRVPTGLTGRAAASVEVPEGGVLDVHYALPAMARMRGEVSDSPDQVPGREWAVALPSVLALLVAVWGFWFAWVLLT